jgi:DNA-binding NarL/FixJ family response regulator
MTAATILIVDDHPMMMLGLSELVADAPDLEVCAKAAHAEEAARLFSQLHPDLVIVDLSLPGESGLSLIGRLKALDSRTRILVLSMHDELLYAERALEAGAMGYVNKSVHSGELLAAIRRVVSGKRYLSQELEERMLARSSGGSRAARSGIESLSARELEVLEWIGRGLRTGEIAERLQLSVKTVERHRENLKDKLGLKSASELVRVALSRTEKP